MPQGRGSSGSTGETSSKGGSSSLHRVDGITILGVVVGLVLVLIALLNDVFALSFQYHAVVAFGGIGLILGAFGSTATYRGKGIVVTGAAAIAVAMSFFFKPPVERYAIGTLHGTADAAGGVVFSPAAKIVGRPSAGEDFRFVFAESGLDAAYLKLTIAFADATPTFECIPKHAVVEYLDSRIIDWEVDRDNGEIRDRTRTPVTVIARSQVKHCGRSASGTPTSGTSGFLGRMIGQAFAGDAVGPDLKLLAAPDVSKRIETRAQILKSLSADAIREQLKFMQSLHQAQPETSLVYDGLLRTWNDLFSQNQSKAELLFLDALDLKAEDEPSADLKFLTQLVGYQVPEVRNSATEFLANIGLIKTETAHSVAIAQTQNALTSKSPRGTLNSLIILRAIKCANHTRGAVTPDMVASVSKLHDSVEPNTQKVLDNISGSVCASP